MVRQQGWVVGEARIGKQRKDHHMAGIMQELAKSNQHWSSGGVRRDLLGDTPRREFSRILDSLGGDKAVALAGPRRSGKTTLMFQTIDYLLWAGMEPKHILYISGGDPGLSAACAASPGSAIRAYEAGVLGERAGESGQPTFIFIDELHNLKGWREWLGGAVADAAAAAPATHYIVSLPSHGMLQTPLRQGGAPALSAGAMECIPVAPLAFSEFAKLCATRAQATSGPASPDAGLDAAKAAELAMPALLGALGKLPQGHAFDGPVEYAMELAELKAELGEAAPAIERLSREYLLAGGYLGYFKARSLPQWQTRLIDDIVLGSLYRDIVSGHTVKFAPTLERLMCFIAENDGRRQSYQTLASGLGVDFTTISSYLGYLSDAYLITILESYPANVGKANRKNKRLHLADSGVASALLHDGGSWSPAYAASLIRLRCVEAARGYAEARGLRYGYWRAPGRAVEQRGENQGSLPPGGDADASSSATAYLPDVSAVVDKAQGALPIDISASGIGASGGATSGGATSGEAMFGGAEPDLRGVEAFMEEFACDEALVATDGWLEVRRCGAGKVACVPFWLI